MTLKPVAYGKYLLIDRVSVGGMAEVFKAMAVGQSGFQKVLAIKRILPNVAEEEGFSQMFVDEANIAGQLHHANIVQIYDLGVIEESLFIAMEFVEGQDLRAIFDRLKKLKQPFPSDLAAFIASQALAGLDYAHRKTDAALRPLNIVHRDVSPPNLILSYEGEVKLIDFGIAKAASKASKTQAGILKGKFGYMSPEQVRGMKVDGRSDVFSISIILWEMLACRRLFVGDTDFATLEKVRGMEIDPPSYHNSQVPEELDRIAMRGLERDVNKRYESALEMQHDLQRYLYSQTPICSQATLTEWMQTVFNEELEHAKQRMLEIEKLDLNHFGIDLEAIEQAEVQSLRTDSVQARPETTVGTPPTTSQNATGEKNEKKESEVQEKAKPPVSDKKTSEKKRVASQKLDLSPEDIHDFPSPSDEQDEDWKPGFSSKALSALLTILLAMFCLVGWYVVDKQDIHTHSQNALGQAGTVMFFANRPEATVRLGEKTLCTTPCRMKKFPAGKHTVHFEKDGFLTDTVHFKMQNKASIEVVGKLFNPGEVQAVLLIQSDPPDADVWIDGENAPNSTPAVINGLPAGKEISVKIGLEGYRDEVRTLTLGKEEFHSLSVSLLPMTPSIRIQSEPEGAAIYVNGRNSGKTTPSRIDQLEDGKSYIVRVVKDRYKYSQQEVTASASKDEKLSFTMEAINGNRTPEPAREISPRFGYLNVFSEPSAKIYIDGRFSGKWSPATHLKLTTGRHELKLINPDYNIHSINAVTIKSGQTTRFRKRFTNP